MEAAQHIVKLGPVAVEVVDRTLIELARDIAMFRPVMDTYVRGAARCAAAGRVRGRRPGREPAPPRAARRADGRPRRAGERRQGGGRRRSAGGVGGARVRPQHHDVDEERGQTRLLHRGLRRAARAPRRLHRAPHRHLRQARHARHLLRARLGRLPARAPGAEPQARTRRQHHARHCRGGVRHGQGLQGLALRRARRRPGALRVPREDVRRQDRAAVRGGEGPLRSGRPDEPRQDRARLAHERPHALPLQAGLRRAGAAHRARLVGLSGRGRRFPGRGGDVQQQRRMPQARRRRHVPLLPHHRQ